MVLTEKIVIFFKFVRGLLKLLLAFSTRCEVVDDGALYKFTLTYLLTYFLNKYFFSLKN